jgi:hypothetical protein
MQPYLFPYPGYFQLIHAVDAFVVYDDVNYITRGWINRNYILERGQARRITLEVSGASQNRRINEIGVGGNRHKLLRQLHHAYAKAPQFDVVFPLLEAVVMHDEPNLARFLANGLQQVCEYLDLRPAWHVSSEIAIDDALRGGDRILALCEALGATHYINLPGGRDLYAAEHFRQQGIRLSFIEPEPIEYPQFGDAFVPNLSIIDLLMFNDRQQCRKLLAGYRLDG